MCNHGWMSYGFYITLMLELIECNQELHDVTLVLVDVPRLHVAVDPVHKVGGLGVHPGVAGLSTPVSPGDHAGEFVAAHEGAAGVSLAGVLAALVEPGADHGVGDVGHAVGVAAVVVRDHGDGHLLEDPGEGAALGGGAPPGHDAAGALIVLLHGGGDGDGADVGAHGDGALEGEHADVVVDGPAVVLLVQAHVRHREGLLVRVVLVEVVAADLHAELVGGHSVTAVAGGDHLVGSNDGAAAHEAAAHTTGQHDLVGELPRVGVGAPDDPVPPAGHRGGQRLLVEAPR